MLYIISLSLVEVTRVFASNLSVQKILTQIYPFRKIRRGLVMRLENLSDSSSRNKTYQHPYPGYCFQERPYREEKKTPEK